VFDAYEIRARLLPAIVAALPALVMLGLGALASEDLAQLPLVILGAAGTVIAIVVRDRGRNLEPGLFRLWGGAPTTQRLRYEGSENPTLVARRHAQLERLIGWDLPDEAQEQLDSNAADKRYDEAVRVLRERVRSDRKTFPLVFAENCGYGFRRNSLGLRPFAVAIAACAGLISAAVLLAGIGDQNFDTRRWALALMLAALLGSYWLMVVKPSWVRRAADLYADRLFEALAGLTTKRRGS
jgi:hypothetical protein